MTVYYVAKTGNDSNAGTAHGSPKLTIAAAVSLAYGSTGNTVEIIDSGEYNEGDIEIYSNAITVMATGTNTPILDGLTATTTEDHAFETYVSGCVFQGLTFRDYRQQLISGWTSSGRDFILSGCIGHSFGTNAPYGQRIGGAGSAEIHDCKIVSDGGVGVIAYSNSKVWINNSVIGSRKPGTAAITSAHSYTNITASFCTFIGSGHNNSNGRNYHLVNQVYKVTNCIVSGSGDGINAYDSTYNLVDVSGDPFIAFTSDHYDGSARSAATGEITGNPLFVSGSIPGIEDSDPDTGGSQRILGNIDIIAQDYGLNAGSPAGEGGVAYNGMVIDLSGNARPDPPSIGAYEITLGYTHKIIDVAAGSLGKILDVVKASVAKVVGT
tara:strand:- start:208 stop:1350 length:1143 start_codon:yes stop_codon:yes gene_type:complete